MKFFNKFREFPVLARRFSTINYLLMYDITISESEIKV